MKSRKNKPTEYGSFSNLLNRVLRADAHDVKAKIEAERKTRKRASKPASASDRASSDKG
jgi:hypothetical protein